jgi:hypothetical protein
VVPLPIKIFQKHLTKNNEILAEVKLRRILPVLTGVKSPSLIKLSYSMLARLKKKKIGWGFGRVRRLEILIVIDTQIINAIFTKQLVLL